MRAVIEKASPLKEAIELAKALESLAMAQKSDADSLDGDGGSTRADLALTRNTARKRQGADEDDSTFIQYYKSGQLIEPTWLPTTLYRIYEESDILGACCRCYVDNIERPHDFEYVGPKDQKDSQSALDNRRLLSDLFSQVNEKHSLTTLRKKIRLDRMIVGNGYVEVLPDPDHQQPDFFYHIPATYMRVTELEKDPIRITTTIPRRGQFRQLDIFKRFRRFGRAMTDGQIQWYKEFGDPRILDKDTGLWIEDSKGLQVREPYDYPNKANEIWWFRDTFGGNTYGVPIWVSAMAEVRGRYLASWVNYDTLDHGGLPPWLLLVYGRLTKGTRDYLMKLTAKWRDPNSYSDPGILEIEPNLMSFNTQGGSKAGAEFVSMRDMRNEESMFSGYRRETREAIGAVFRLPPVLYGYTEGAGGTNYAALETAESQVFDPLRRAFDERVTVELIQQRFGIFDWALKTKAAPIGDKETLYKALGRAQITGGPSINDAVKMQNETFGTQWPEREHPFYSQLSAMEAGKLITQGQVVYHLSEDSKTYEPEILAPQNAIQAGDIGNVPNGGPTGEDSSSEFSEKSDDENTNEVNKAEETLLLDALKRVQREYDDYEPPVEITEEDLEI